MTFVLQPVPKNLVDQGVAKGGNPLGLPRENHQCRFIQVRVKHSLVADRVWRQGGRLL